MSSVGERRLAEIDKKPRCRLPCQRCVRRWARGEFNVAYCCRFATTPLYVARYKDSNGNIYNKCGYCIWKNDQECLHLPESVRDLVAPLQTALEKLTKAEAGRDIPARTLAETEVKNQAQILKDWIEELGKADDFARIAHNGKDTWAPSTVVFEGRDRSKMGIARKAAADRALLEGDDETAALLMRTPTKKSKTPSGSPNGVTKKARAPRKKN